MLRLSAGLQALHKLAMDFRTPVDIKKVRQYGNGCMVAFMLPYSMKDDGTAKSVFLQ